MQIDDTNPWPYEARARSGDQLVAVSTDARRYESEDESPVLLFPAADLIADAADLPDGAVLEGTPDGWVAFDPAALTVELVDGPTGAEPRDLTVTRFPNWGDAADLIRLIDVHPAGDGGYDSALRQGHGRSIVEASQMLGQAIVAACREVPGRRVVSAMMVFNRIVQDTVPFRIELDTLASGRSFASFAAHVVQNDRRCASGVLLLGATSADVMRHDAEAPDVAGPYDSEPLDMGVTGRDVRVVDGAYTNDADAPVGPPVIDAWVRFREAPDDQPIHAALLAQFTGHMSIATAMRPHAGIGQEQAHRSLSTAINAIDISFHADVKVNDWLLYRHLSTFAGDGMTHSECRVHDTDGALVASFTVDAMVKPFESKTPMSEKAAL